MRRTDRGASAQFDANARRARGCKSKAREAIRIRVLIIDTYYPAFLGRHYAECPHLTEAPYELQWRALMDRFFGTSDSYSHFLMELGHEAQEVVVNCEPLQTAWAREHGLKTKRGFRLRSPHPIIEAQVEEFRPDVVYVQDLNALSTKTLRALRRRNRLLVGQIASEAPPRSQLEPFQLVLTSFPHFAKRFADAGIPSEYFRIGFDPRVLELMDGSPSSEVVFVGGLGTTQHSRGSRVLAEAARRAPIDFWGYGVDAWPADSDIRRRYRGEAWGLAMYRILAGAKIALNRHIDVAEDHANNMRLYEATGVGTLLITDMKSNLADLFEPGREVVTYTSAEQLVAEIERFLHDDDARERIARAGQVRTLASHTYRNRMLELQDILSRYLS
jgi:spore maturation protein CgeB